jgi:hypothetical protein
MLNFLLFVLVFLLASAGSSVLMVKLGYPLPKSLSTRYDWLLLLYKLILFTIFVLVQLAILMIFKIDLIGLTTYITN